MHLQCIQFVKNQLIHNILLIAEYISREQINITNIKNLELFRVYSFQNDLLELTRQTTIRQISAFQPIPNKKVNKITFDNRICSRTISMVPFEVKK